jgi:DNA-binding XRE family transcriptional regulator
MPVVECPPTPGSASGGPEATLASALERLAAARRSPRAFQRDPTLQRLATELVRARAGAGLTQREVARKMWTTQSAVSRLERGRTTRPSLTTIEKYALAVGCRVEIRLKS